MRLRKGFVVATVAILEKIRATPSKRRGLDGNICRCGTFVRIVEAAVGEGGGSWLAFVAREVGSLGTRSSGPTVRTK
jgi:hypothetical protein